MLTQATRSHRLSRRLAAGVAAVAVALATPPAGATDPVPPVEPAAPAGAPDLVVTGPTLGEGYIAGDAVTGTITIRNTGTAPAENIHAKIDTTEGWEFPGDNWEKIDTPGSGVTIPPSGEKVITLRGTAADINKRTLTLNGSISATRQVDGKWEDVDANPADNVVHATAGLRGLGGVKVTILRGGEPVPGLSVDLAVGGRPLNRAGTTDARGEHTFTKVPVDTYDLVTRGPNTLVVPIVPVRVKWGETAAVRVLTLPSSRVAVAASISFDKRSYAPDDAVAATVTLTNRTGEPLSGITAECDASGGNRLSGQGEGWGDLRTGVSLPAGETREFTVTDTLPPESKSLGTVAAFCTFGAFDDPEDGRSPAQDGAGVDGVSGRTKVRLYQDHNANDRVDAGEELAGVRAALVHLRSHDVTVTGETNSRGEIDFTDVAANFYQLRPLGPWRTAAQDVVELVNADRERVDLRIEPGRTEPTPEPGEAGAIPVPDGRKDGPAPNRTAPRLASTGFAQPWLVPVGVTLVLAGTALLLLRRRVRV